MIFDHNERTLTLDMKDCTTCYGRGDVSTALPCPTGGKGPRGGANGCRTCHGFGNHYDHENRVPCKNCQGEPARKSPETFYDSVSQEVLMAMLPLTVVRQDRAGTWIEYNLGALDAVWSTTDYGRSWDLTDEEVAEQVAEKLRTERGVQGVKILHKFEREDQVARLKDKFVVVLHRSGYNVVAA